MKKFIYTVCCSVIFFPILGKTHSYFFIGENMNSLDNTPFSQIMQDIYDPKEDSFGRTGVIPRWHTRTIKFETHTVFPKGIEWTFSEEAFRNKVKASVEKWGRSIPFFQLKFNRSMHDRIGDGVITIKFDTEAKSIKQEDATEASADPMISFKNGAEYTDCVIWVRTKPAKKTPPRNSNQTEDEIQKALTPEEQLNQIAPFITHEIGHCLGLGHSEVPSSTMSYPSDMLSVYPNTKKEFSDDISVDDVVALTGVYQPIIAGKSTMVSGSVECDGSPMYGARVVFMNKEKQPVVEAFSGVNGFRNGVVEKLSCESGKFFIHGIPAGVYDVEVSAYRDASYGYIPFLTLRQDYFDCKTKVLGNVRVVKNKKLDLGLVNLTTK